MSQTFRLRKSVKYQGMAFTAMFLAVVVVYSSIFFLEEPAKHGFKGEHSAALAGGMGVAVFGTALLMAIYMWAAYHVERFTIDGSILSIRSMLQNRSFDVSELNCLKWRVYPLGGSIFFRSDSSKARLDLYGFGRDDRLEIIRAIHSAAPPHVQEGWPLFCHRVALPLRDGTPSIVRCEPSIEFDTITRKRYDRMLAFLLPSSLAVAIAIGVLLNLWHFVALPLLVVGSWALLRSSVPSEGRREIRLSSTSQGRTQLIACGAVLSPLLLAFALMSLGVRESVACMVALVGFPIMLWLIYRLDKKRKVADGEAAELAVADWQQSDVENAAAANVNP